MSASDSVSTAAAAAAAASTLAAAAVRAARAERLKVHGSTPRPPSDSHLEMIYPFSSSKKLSERFRLFQGDHLRLGVLMDDLDLFAGES